MAGFMVRVTMLITAYNTLWPTHDRALCFGAERDVAACPGARRVSTLPRQIEVSCRPRC